MRKLSVLFSMILIVSLALAPMAGCQQDSESADNQESKPADTQETETADSQETESGSPAEVSYILEVTVAPDGAGDVSPSGGIYDAGSEATITATPAQGYIFDHWSGDDTGNTNPINLTMDSNKSVTANFTLHLEDGIIFQDNFDDDSNEWPGNVQDGVLYLSDQTVEGQQAITEKYKWPPAAPYYPDFGYEVEITTLEGDPSVARGIIFLCQNSQEASKSVRYTFAISGNGSYTLLIAEDERRPIVSWTESDYINTGNATNVLKVICQNSVIELYVNGHLLESVSGEFPEDIGDNGIGLFLVATEVKTSLAIDNVKMWALNQ